MTVLKSDADVGFVGALRNTHASHAVDKLGPTCTEKAGNFAAGQAAPHVLTDL